MFELLELTISIPLDLTTNNFNSFEGPNGKYWKVDGKNIMYCNGSEADRSRFRLILNGTRFCNIFILDSKLTAPMDMFLCGVEAGTAVTISDDSEATTWSF